MAGERHRIFRETIELPDDKIDLGRAALGLSYRFKLGPGGRR